MFQLIIQLIKLTNAQFYPTIIMTETDRQRERKLHSKAM